MYKQMNMQMNMIQNNIVSSPKQGKPRWNPKVAFYFIDRAST